MAKYGAKRPIFAPIKKEPEEALPEYNEIVVIGRLVQVNVNPVFASGQLYADNELAENAAEFVRADATMETDDILDEVAEVIYGVKVTDGEAEYNTGDVAPPGGVAFYVTLMRRGVKYHKGYYYPRAQAVLGNDQAQSKGDSITFGTSTTGFTVFASKTGAWRRTRTFTTEAEVVKWCEEKLGGVLAQSGKQTGAALENMTISELRTYASDNGIEIPSGTRVKADILDVILESLETHEEITGEPEGDADE